MKREQFDAARKLYDEQRSVGVELEIWNKNLTYKSQMGYKSPDTEHHHSSLKSNVPTSIFEGFRASCISALKARLAEIEVEIKNI